MLKCRNSRNLHQHDLGALFSVQLVQIVDFCFLDTDGNDIRRPRIQVRPSCRRMVPCEQFTYDLQLMFLYEAYASWMRAVGRQIPDPTLGTEEREDAVAPVISVACCSVGIVPSGVRSSTAAGSSLTGG